MDYKIEKIHRSCEPGMKQIAGRQVVAVLEVPAGFCDAYEIREGQTIDVDRREGMNNHWNKMSRFARVQEMDVQVGDEIKWRGGTARQNQGVVVQIDEDGFVWATTPDGAKALVDIDSIEKTGRRMPLIAKAFNTASTMGGPTIKAFFSQAQGKPIPPESAPGAGVDVQPTTSLPSKILEPLGPVSEAYQEAIESYDMTPERQYQYKTRGLGMTPEEAIQPQGKRAQSIQPGDEYEGTDSSGNPYRYTVYDVNDEGITLSTERITEHGATADTLGPMDEERFLQTVTGMEKVGRGVRRFAWSGEEEDVIYEKREGIMTYRAKEGRESGFIRIYAEGEVGEIFTGILSPTREKAIQDIEELAREDKQLFETVDTGQFLNAQQVFKTPIEAVHHNAKKKALKVAQYGMDLENMGPAAKGIYAKISGAPSEWLQSDEGNDLMTRSIDHIREIEGDESANALELEFSMLVGMGGMSAHAVKQGGGHWADLAKRAQAQPYEYSGSYREGDTFELSISDIGAWDVAAESRTKLAPGTYRISKMMGFGRPDDSWHIEDNEGRVFITGGDDLIKMHESLGREVKRAGISEAISLEYNAVKALTELGIRDPKEITARLNVLDENTVKLILWHLPNYGPNEGERIAQIEPKYRRGDWVEYTTPDGTVRDGVISKIPDELGRPSEIWGVVYEIGGAEVEESDIIGTVKVAQAQDIPGPGDVYESKAGSIFTVLAQDDEGYLELGVLKPDGSETTVHYLPEDIQKAFDEGDFKKVSSRTAGISYAKGEPSKDFDGEPLSEGDRVGWVDWGTGQPTIVGTIVSFPMWGLAEMNFPRDQLKQHGVDVSGYESGNIRVPTDELKKMSSRQAQVGCPVCGGERVQGCRCASRIHDAVLSGSEADRIAYLNKGHGSECANGHKWIGSTVITKEAQASSKEEQFATDVADQIVKFTGTEKDLAQVLELIKGKSFSDEEKDAAMPGVTTPTMAGPMASRDAQGGEKKMPDPQEMAERAVEMMVPMQEAIGDMYKGPPPSIADQAQQMIKKCTPLRIQNSHR